MRNLVLIVKLKKLEITHRGVLLLVKVTLLHGCFHILKIVQVVPNRAKHHITLSFNLVRCSAIKGVF